MRGAAAWLALNTAHAAWPRINGFPTADYYFPRFDFAYIDRDSSRFRAYACRRGTEERWGGLPLIYSLPELVAKAAAAGGAFLVAASRDGEPLINLPAGWTRRIVWRSLDSELEILALAAPNKPAGRR